MSTRYTVLVKTSAKDSRVLFCEQNRISVQVSAPRVKGKANRELLKLLKKHFNKPVRLVSGSRSKKKIIEV